ncbi:MAG: FAD:protein FMN transferase [Ruminococcus sp.]|nr:FAD:protein FMN transferase [Ruminococcus sp.]
MMKRILSLFVTLTTILILTACMPTVNESRFFAMDTAMSVKVWGSEELCRKLEDRAETLDDLLSTTDENSEIARLNSEHTATLSELTLRLLRRTLELSADMREYFDPTVYPAVVEWGFIDEHYRVPDDEWLSTLSSLIDSSRVKLDGDTATLPAGMQLTLGATAKGYLADECEAILSENNAPCAILNLGGTILLHGKKPDNTRFKVGVADPENPASYFGYLTCDQGIVATSGGYERYFEQDGKRYIHILDPTTAKPVDNGTLSVTIFSDDGTRADALSTALFVMGVDKAAEYYRSHPDFDFILLTDDGTCYVTEGVYDDFTLADGFDFSIRKITL